MTFDKPTYREKFLLLLACFGLLAVVGYKKSIVETIALHHECNRLEKELLHQDEIEERIEFYSQAINSQIAFKGTNKIESKQLQKVLLNEIATYCEKNQIELNELEDPHVIQEGKYLVSTQEFTMKGGYHELLKFINYLERNFDLSHISSVLFLSKKDRKSGKINVYATIYLQKISIS